METKFHSRIAINTTFDELLIPSKTLPYQRSLFKTLHPKNGMKLAEGFRRVNWQPSNSFYRHIIVTFKMSQPRPSRCPQFRGLGSALRALNAPPSTTASPHRITPPHHSCKTSPFFGGFSDKKELM